MKLEEKDKQLEKLIRELGKVAIAFSGGVDSTFLLYRAKQVLGENVTAILAASETFPEREYNAAVKLARDLDVPLIETTVQELTNPLFTANDKERCYHCKSGLFSHLKTLGAQEGFHVILDGSNFDDLSDYRPGSRARDEQEVRSPLQEVGLGKEEIRQLSRAAGLSTWDKPSFACLSSRIPYGKPIDEQKINQLDQAENFLLQLGFRQVRIRHHETIARIEVEPADMEKMLQHRLEITAALKKVGFTYVTLDLSGYRTGSMNEVL